VRALVIVEVEIVFERRKQFQAAGEVAGIDQLVLERAPQPFDENVVECASRMRISRRARWRPTPNWTAIFRLPKKGNFRYHSSRVRSSRKFSALSGRGW